MPKTLFIDSTPDIDRVWRKVHKPNDIPIAVNIGAVAEADIPKKVEGYDTVINDATYFTRRAEARAAAQSPSRDPPGPLLQLRRACRRSARPKNSRQSTGTATTVGGLTMAGLVGHIATMHGMVVRAGAWRPMRANLELKGKTLGIVGLGGIGREMARIGQGVGSQGHRLQQAQRSPIRPCRWSRSTSCWRGRTSSACILPSTTRRGFLDRAKLEKTKPGVIVVNTARAGVVDEAAPDRSSTIRPHRAFQTGRVRQGADAGGRAPPPTTTLTSHAG